jgi:hypothetical protein
MTTHGTLEAFNNTYFADYYLPNYHRALHSFNEVYQTGLQEIAEGHIGSGANLGTQGLTIAYALNELATNLGDSHRGARAVIESAPIVLLGLSDLTDTQRSAYEAGVGVIDLVVDEEKKSKRSEAIIKSVRKSKQGEATSEELSIVMAALDVVVLAQAEEKEGIFEAASIIETFGSSREAKIAMRGIVLDRRVIQKALTTPTESQRRVFIDRFASSPALGPAIDKIHTTRVS